MPAALPFVDLERVPFTAPGSRFVVRRSRGRIEILHVRYEVPIDQCVAARIDCGIDGRIRALGGHLEVNAMRIAILGEEVRVLGPGCRVEPGDDGAPDVRVDAGPVRTVLSGAGARRSELGDSEFVEAADSVVGRWMDRLPAVAGGRTEMARQCWWVLGANTLEIAVPGGVAEQSAPRRRTVVVPSKMGYVALWQWDAYFIAIGLRGGAPGLALEQLETAFGACEDGQLPDVVHDGGVLASSRDLPPADRERLEASGSRSGDNGAVPLTKPPLGAWAADRVLETLPADQRRRLMARWFPVLTANQDWWFRVGDSDGDGVPEYAHPYSSGLDDSPVFDGAFPVVTPDLLAYLVVQDEVLARWADDLGDAVPGARRIGEACRARSASTRRALDGLWDPRRQMFEARDAGGSGALPRTIVSLLACFAGGLPDDRMRGLIADIEDEHRFAGAWPLATVSRDEKDFEPQTMWRGPVWINTNYLVAEGLERCGHPQRARRLRRATLDLVERAGGPVEYMDPRTGNRSPAAAANFSWSAALYLDLAVREAAEPPR